MNRHMSIALYMFDTKCTADTTIDTTGKALSSYPLNFFKLVLGPSCFLHSLELATVTYSYSIFQIDMISAEAISSNGKFPLFCRMRPASLLISQTTLRVFLFFDWKFFDCIRTTAGQFVIDQIVTLIDGAGPLDFYANFTLRNLLEVQQVNVVKLNLTAGGDLLKLIKELKMRIILMEGHQFFSEMFYCSLVYFDKEYGHLIENLYIIGITSRSSNTFWRDIDQHTNSNEFCLMKFDNVSKLAKYSLAIDVVNVHLKKNNTIHGITDQLIVNIDNNVTAKCIVNCNLLFNAFYDGVAGVMSIIENGMTRGLLSHQDFTYINSTTRLYLYNEFSKLKFEGLMGSMEWFQDGSCERSSSFVLKQVRHDLLIEDIAVFDYSGVDIHAQKIPSFLLPIQWGTPNTSMKLSNITSVNLESEKLLFPVAHVDCPFGSSFNRSSGIFNRNCDECSPGTEPIESECVPCQIGTFSKNGTKCINCENGYYQLETGQVACRPCPIGTLWKSGVECVSCPPGRFNPSAGLIADSCRICPFGSYQTMEKSSECTLCSSFLGGSTRESFTTLQPGSSMPTDCVCARGYFLSCLGKANENHVNINVNRIVSSCLIDSIPRGRQCLPCPKGFVCNGGLNFIPENSTIKIHTQPILKEGFMSLTSDPYIAYKCPLSKTCRGGPIGYASCTDNRFDIACGKCPTNYYQLKEECRRCAWYSYVVFGIVLLLIPTCTFLIYAFCNGEYGTALSRGVLTAIYLGMVLTLVQTVAVFGQLSINYPSGIQKIFDIISVLTVNLDFLNFSCISGNNPVDLYILLCCIPLMLPIWIYIFYYITNKQLTPIIDRVNNEYILFAVQPWLKPHALNTFGHIFQAFFILIIAVVSAPFSCYSHPQSGQSVYPNVIAEYMSDNDNTPQTGSPVRDSHVVGQ